MGQDIVLAVRAGNAVGCVSTHLLFEMYILNEEMRLDALYKLTIFEIHLSKGEYLNGVTVSARATTLSGALDFIGEFYEGPLFLSWIERDGLYVVEVRDWIDCSFDDPPVRARVITPHGFVPPDCRIWTRVGFGQRGSYAPDK